MNNNGKGFHVGESASWTFPTQGVFWEQDYHYNTGF